MPEHDDPESVDRAAFAAKRPALMRIVSRWAACQRRLARG